MHCADAPSVYVVPMSGVQRLPGRDLDIRMFPEPSVHFQILRSGGVGVSPDEIEGAKAEDGAMVSQSHRMIDMQSLAVDEPVLAWVVIVSIPDSLDTERNPPRKRDVIVVPKGDEVPSSKAHRGIQFLPEGMERQPAFRTCASIGTRADRASFGRLGGTSHGCTLLRPRIPETAG